MNRNLAIAAPALARGGQIEIKILGGGKARFLNLDSQAHGARCARPARARLRKRQV